MEPVHVSGLTVARRMRIQQRLSKLHVLDASEKRCKSSIVFDNKERFDSVPKLSRTTNQQSDSGIEREHRPTYCLARESAQKYRMKYSLR